MSAADPLPFAARRPPMRSARRLGRRSPLLLGLSLGVTGCHNLQEHRRARWNYGPGMERRQRPVFRHLGPGGGRTASRRAELRRPGAVRERRGNRPQNLVRESNPRRRSRQTLHNNAAPPSASSATATATPSAAPSPTARSSVASNRVRPSGESNTACSVTRRSAVRYRPHAHRGVAAGPEAVQTRPFGVDLRPGRGVVQRGEGGATWPRRRPGTRSLSAPCPTAGSTAILQPAGNAAGQPQPVQPGLGEDRGRANSPAVELRQPGADVPPGLPEPQIRPQRAATASAAAASRCRRSRPCGRSSSVPAAPCGRTSASHRLARCGDGGERQPRHGAGGEVFEGVHREVRVRPAARPAGLLL